MARERANQAALTGTAAELEQAKRDWQAAIDALQESDVGSESNSKGPNSLNQLKQLQASLAQSAASTMSQQSGVETKSTFNAFAIRGLGADSLSDRALRAAEATADNTKKIIQTIENNGLAYT